MSGGTGDDTYIVDSTSDTVTENISGVTNVETVGLPLPMALMLVQKNQRKLLLVSIPLLVLPVQILAVFSGTINP